MSEIPTFFIFIALYRNILSMESRSLWKTFFLVLALIILMNFQCGDNGPCVGEENVTSFPATISPNTSSVSVGDTLWVESEFDTELPLSNKNGMISLDSAECITFLNVMKVENHTIEVIEGLRDFEYINLYGSLEQTDFQDQRREFESTIYFSCGNDKCRFKIGMIPQRQGFYCLWIRGGKFQKPGEEELLCPPLNRFRDIVFEIEDFNQELYAQQNVKGVLRFPVRSSSGAIQVVGNEAAYIFEVR